MIAREHAETTGKDGQRFGDGELGGEIRDRDIVLRLLRLIPAISREVIAQIVRGRFDGRDKALILCSDLKRDWIDSLEQQTRIVFCGGPQRGIESLEENASLGVPTPAQVS